MRNSWPGAPILDAALAPHGSARELAEALGVSPGTVSRWRRGSWPDRGQLAAIEEHLGVTLSADPATNIAQTIANHATRIAVLEEAVRVLQAGQKQLIDREIVKTHRDPRAPVQSKQRAAG